MNCPCRARIIPVLSIASLVGISSLAAAQDTLTFRLEAPPAHADSGDSAPESEEAYSQWLAKQLERLTDAANEAGPADRRAAALRAASFALSQSAAPPLSRVLQEIATSADCQSLDSLVAAARSQLKDLPPAASAPATRPAAASLDPDYLESLCKAYAALAAVTAFNLQAPTAADPAAAPASQPAVELTRELKSQLTDACSDLAGWLDDDRPLFSGPARVLQAACYRRAGRNARALEVLQSAPPNGLSLPWQVYTWTEYCMAMAAAGNESAAISLNIRLEALVSSSAPLAHRTPAAFTLRAVRWRILRSWRAALAAGDGHDSLTLATTSLDRLRASFGARDGIALLRLTGLP